MNTGTSRKFLCIHIDPQGLENHCQRGDATISTIPLEQQRHILNDMITILKFLHLATPPCATLPGNHHPDRRVSPIPGRIRIPVKGNLYQLFISDLKARE